MSANTPCQSLERRLREWEIVEARTVFGDALDYARVRIHECASWTDAANRLGMWLKRIPLPPAYVPNAITLGDHCYFPIQLPETLALWDRSPYSFGWVIHELTHAWQYQHLGWKYLTQALSAQFRHGAAAYDFGDAAGLAAAQQAGEKFSSFNPEQQGAIVQAYYDRLRANRDVTAWMPFVHEIQART